MSSIQQVAVIGAASGKGQDYITALLERPDDVKIVAIVINNTMPQKVQDWVTQYGWKVITEGKVEQLNTIKFDTAVVALPHEQHYAVTEQLLKFGVYVIKEKPLGISLQDAEKLTAPIFTTVQRSTHPLFVEAKQDLPKIGPIFSFNYTYAFDLKSQTSGWRADPEKSGGGVVLDMGYHAIDVLNDFFGMPEHTSSQFGYAYPEMQEKRLEDSSIITFTYKTFEGKLILDRHAAKREERFVIQGELGRIEITPTTYDLIINGSPVKQIQSTFSKIEIIQKMFDVCLKGSQEYLQGQFDRNVNTMRIIDRIYSQK